MADQLLLLLGDSLRGADGTFVVWVFNRRSLVGALAGAHRVLLLASDHDDVAVPYHLEDVVAMMGHRHELGQVRISKDDVVRKADVGDVEVDELGAVVVALAKVTGRQTCPIGVVEPSVIPEKGLVG